jgi:hypothetical protein
MMKRFTVLTSVSVLALALAVGGVGRLYAETAQPASTTVHEQISGGASAQQRAEMSEHGLAAMNDIQMARLAVNDGYVDNAKRLLTEAKALLEQVEQEDAPVTVTTEVKVGDDPVEKETVSERPDLIPILGKMQLIEGYAAAVAAQQSAADNLQAKPDEAANADAAANDEAVDTAQAETKPDAEARSAAVAQAKEQMRSGDQAGAVETLRLVDLGMVSQVVSMPLAETGEHVEKALQLIDDDKLHQANLELKQATDGLVVHTRIIVEPVPAVPGGDDAEAQSEQAG